MEGNFSVSDEADFPDTEMNAESRELLNEGPMAWAVLKNRALRMALEDGNEELLDRVVDDIVHVFGRKAWWVIYKMVEMVNKEVNDSLG